MAESLKSYATQDQIAELNSKLNWRTLYSFTTFQDDVGRTINIDLTDINLVDVLLYDTSISAASRYHIIAPVVNGMLGATYFAIGFGSTNDIIRIEISNGHLQLLSHKNTTQICVGAIYGKA